MRKFFKVLSFFALSLDKSRASIYNKYNDANCGLGKRGKEKCFLCFFNLFMLPEGEE